MVRLQLFPKLILVATLVLVPACADADQEPGEVDVVVTAPSEEQVEAEVDEAQEAVEAYSEAQVEEFRAETAEELAQLNAQIDYLEDQAQVEMQDELVELRQEAAEAQAELDALGQATAENWEQLEDNVEVAMANLGDRLNQAAATAGVALDQAGDEIAEESAQAGQEVAEEAAEADQNLEQESAELNLELQEKMANLNAYTVDQRVEFQEDVTALLQDYNVLIDDLEAHVVEADAATQAELNEEIALLRQQRDQLQQQVSELEAASPEDWQQMKLDIMAGIEALDESFEVTEERVG
jgi:hypothetical protein